MKKLYLYIGIIIIIGVLNSVFAQQQSVYSNFLVNNYYYNPALAGSNKTSVVDFSARKQWFGFKGSPFLMRASYHGSYKNQGKYGFGGSLISENMGITNRFGIYLNYAQQFRLFNEVKLGLGIRPGYLQYSAKLYQAQIADKGDQTLSGNNYSGGAFDIDMGFNIYSPKFFVMASFNHILRTKEGFAPYNTNLAFHFNAIIGYNFQLKPKKKGQNIVLQPSLMLKYVKPAPPQLCIMFKSIFNDKYWAGLLFRTNDAIGLSLGMKIKDRFWISYTYDYTLGRLMNYQSGSHEIALSYILNWKKKSLEQRDKELNKSIMDANKKDLEHSK